MFILKVIGKILLVPVWILSAIATAFVSAIVKILGFAKVITGIILTLLLVGTIICYQDLTQALFLIVLICIGYAILIAGVSVELAMEMIRDKLKNVVFA